MSTANKVLTFVSPVVIAASALTFASAVPSASVSDAPFACDAEAYIDLVVRNGQDQYFVCYDSTAGEIRQTFTSKNPWLVDPQAPALFAQPSALPAGADGQVFTGASQGVGVVSVDDATGEQRDVISNRESLTLTRDASLDRNFDGLQLGVKVRVPATTLRVDAVDSSGQTIATQTATRNVGTFDIPFFSDRTLGAAGFRISAASGQFSLDGGQTTRFFFDVAAAGPVSGLTVEDETESSVTLAWTNPTDPDLAEVVVQRDGTTVFEGSAPESFTDTNLTPGTTYVYSVFTRDSSGNESAAETVEATTLNVFEEGGDTSAVVNFEDSAIQATFNGGDNCAVAPTNPLPYELTLDSPGTIGVGGADASVAFDFTVFPGEDDVSGCRFTLEIFSATTENLDLFFDPDGAGAIFPEPVEQLLCVGDAPTAGSGSTGSPNLDVSCIESMTLASAIPGSVAQNRDGQQWLLTGFFDARGFLR
jgi:hypothetical protein